MESVTSKLEVTETIERVNLNPYLTIEQRLERHEIPIKAEFLKEVFADAVEQKQSRPTEDDPPPQKKGRYTKSERKKRKDKKQRQAFNGKGICHTIAMGETCTIEKCRFSHDIEGYLKEKESDIGDRCYIFDQEGVCRFGFRCRFSGAHIKDGKIVKDEEKMKQKEKPSVDNILDKDIQFGLRKKKIVFEKAKKAVKTYANGNLGFLQDFPDDTEGNIVLESGTKKNVDFHDKLILAPLTTIGNLPFRRICKEFGVDITVGEMALATQLMSGSPTEWALVKRHESEDVFGVQLAGSHANAMAASAELLNSKMNIDFIDINCGCPIDLVCNKGAGSSLLNRKGRLESICRSMVDVMDIPLTIKIRMGVQDKNPVAHELVPLVKEWGVSAVTLHGRSKEQRYTKAANLEYMTQCAKLSPVPFICNGDTYSWQDAVAYRENNPTKSIMLARGAIIKPWIFKEIKEQKDYDISGSERLDIIRNFVNYGLEHWGSDRQGVENVRHFLLNWMSFLYRYVPIGIVEHLPIQINHRPPMFVGRDDKETLLSSSYVKDWIEISEMFLGPVPKDFSFIPKHKANSYPQP